jgi:hypothetical protein
MSDKNMDEGKTFSAVLCALLFANWIISPQTEPKTAYFLAYGHKGKGDYIEPNRIRYTADVSSQTVTSASTARGGLIESVHCAVLSNDTWQCESDHSSALDGNVTLRYGTGFENGAMVWTPVHSVGFIHYYFNQFFGIEE